MAGSVEKNKEDEGTEDEGTEDEGTEVTGNSWGDVVIVNFKEDVNTKLSNISLEIDKSILRKLEKMELCDKQKIAARIWIVKKLEEFYNDSIKDMENISGIYFAKDFLKTE